MKVVKLTIDGMAMSFESARAFAEVTASRLAGDYLMIAWFDGKKGEEHPCIPECSHKPGWLAYAEGHGGNIRVELNDGEFVFIFTALDALNDETG